MNTSKPGWKTTEFWFTALLVAADVAAVAAGMLPPETGALLATASTGIYKLVRGASKFGADELGTAARAALGGTGATLAQANEASKSLGSALAPRNSTETP